MIDRIAGFLTGIMDLSTAMIGSPWLYLLVLAIVIAGAFLIVVPSETLVVALGAVALSTGQPNALILIAVATVGAILGDSLTYWGARRTDVSRFAWTRAAKPAAAFDWANRALERRAVSVLLTARFIPLGRIIINLTAGTTRMPYRRFLILTTMSGAAWAAFNVLVGALFGQLFGGNTLLAVAVSVVVAVALGTGIDRMIQHIPSRHSHPRRSSLEPVLMKG